MTSASSYHLDRPAKDDALGRAHFAKMLANALPLPKDSDGFVVGIEGNWGSGKSTLIGFIKQHLSDTDNAQGKPIIVEFNPWMVSNTGALVEALITQIAAAIGKDFEYGQKGIQAGQTLLNYVGLIKNLKYLKYLKYFPATGWLGNIAESISDAAETATEAVDEGVNAGQEALDDTKKLLATVDLSKQKAIVVDALRDLERPIVVIVDDLDRLPVVEIQSMIQTIKAVADFPRTTYLLAYDRAVVARALGSGDEAAGLSYLEKIVQVVYPIPPLFQRQLNKFAEDKVGGLLAVLGITLRDYEIVHYGEALYLLAHLSRHPRDIVRIVNRLLLSLPATRGEVNAVDVIVFEALSQRFPKLREDIHNDPLSFIGHSFRGDLVADDDEMEWAYWAAGKKENNDPLWIKYLPNDDRERRIAQKACQFLFPSEMDREKHTVHEDQLRIADPDRLARYFRMTSIEDVPEVSEIHDMLANPMKLASALATNNDKELLSLLEWIYNYLPSANIADAKGCVVHLIAASNDIMAQGRLSDQIARLFSKVMKRVLGKAGNERNECFMTIATLAPLSLAEDVVLTAVADQGKWVVRPNERKHVDKQLIPDNSLVDEATRIWSTRVREAISKGELHKQPHMHSILYRLAQFNNAFDEVHQAVWQICATNEGLGKFLSTFVKDSPFNTLDRFALIDDSSRLAQLIEKSPNHEAYQWLSSELKKPDMISAINGQAASLKNPKKESE